MLGGTPGPAQSEQIPPQAPRAVSIRTLPGGPLKRLQASHGDCGVFVFLGEVTW